jgi:hypothetical protein
MNTQALIQIGFAPAGSCSIDPGLKGGVRFTLTHLRQERVIYAFTVNSETKYIGVCDNTETCFADRMSRYQGLIGAGTNKRIVALIKASLAQARTVQILAWKPSADLVVAGLRVDLVKGLENPLIGWARPEWNIKR